MYLFELSKSNFTEAKASSPAGLFKKKITEGSPWYAWCCGMM
jgi:hypothetical protein